MAWVRKYYNVPAKRGGRVKYTGGREPQIGTIKSARGGKLRIQLDAWSFPAWFHPTWELEYLEPAHD